MIPLPLGLSVPLVYEVENPSFADDQLDAVVAFLSTFFKQQYPYVEANTLPLLDFTHMGYMEDMDDTTGEERAVEMYVVYSPALLGRQAESTDMALWEIVFEHMQRKWGTDHAVKKDVYENTLVGVEIYNEEGEDELFRPAYKDYKAWVAQRMKKSILKELDPKETKRTKAKM